jgi:dTDP-4-dehydrorhamnose reductase
VLFRSLSFAHLKGKQGVLITGKTGTLGQAFARLCQQRGIRHQLLCRQDLDIASPESVARALDALRPWAVVNCAGFVRIDEAEGDPESCYRENTLGPALLAAECQSRGVALLTFSTDMVFDGKKGAPYHEKDPVAPVNTYGLSKAEAERQVLKLYPGALVVRSSAFFGPWDDYNFATVTLRLLARGERVPAASDLYVSPTYLPDLVHASLDLLLDGERGIWHISNHGSVSWAEFAHRCAGLAGLDPSRITPRPAESFGYRAARPACVPLSSVRGGTLPDLEDAIRRYLADAAPLYPTP